jgi:hypothetical protein
MIIGHAVFHNSYRSATTDLDNHIYAIIYLPALALRERIIFDSSWHPATPTTRPAELAGIGKYHREIRI